MTARAGELRPSFTMTCIIAGTTSDWYTTGGGTSSIGGFHDSGPNTCFVFSAGALTLFDANATYCSPPTS